MITEILGITLTIVKTVDSLLIIKIIVRKLLKTFFESVEYKKLPVIDIPSTPTPPKIAEYLIYLLIPRKNREVMLGDLEEDFQEVRKKFGLRKAKFHYWFQVLRSIPPLISSSVLKMVVASITKALKTSN